MTKKAPVTAAPAGIGTVVSVRAKAAVTALQIVALIQSYRRGYCKRGYTWQLLS